MVAVRGKGQEGYLAFDDVEFLLEFKEDQCNFLPTEAAVPSEEDPTTETTTVTEPPYDWINCQFEASQGFCDWMHTQDDDNYAFFRNTSNGLEEAGILGPGTDNLEAKDKFFVMTSSFLAQEVLPGKRARLISPTFVGKEHPYECFSFWFYFGRGGDGETLYIKLVQNVTFTTVWKLTDAYVDQFKTDQWHRAQVFYKLSNPDLNYHVRIC